MATALALAARAEEEATRTAWRAAVMATALALAARAEWCTEARAAAAARARAAAATSTAVALVEEARAARMA